MRNRLGQAPAICRSGFACRAAWEIEKMRDKKKVELLAPAGSLDSLRAAVAAGADAAYMGGPRFGARAYAENADEEGLLGAIDYVHLHGRRLYMTVNTLFKEDELDGLVEYMTPFYRQGVDGVIVQDLGALRVMREHFPGMELHASTQMTITGVWGAKLLKDLGCCRVVPAREISLEEIARIRRETGLEVETFIHGALCYCYSGQCLMSSMIGGRSGNRGRCAQPCRLPYQVWEDGKPVLKGNVLSLKDLCTLDILPDILEAGVYSLKIEGRMKSPRYVAGVVSIYRKYVDRYLEWGKEGYYVEPEDRKALLDLATRPEFTQGYYKKHNGRDMIALGEKPAFRPGNQALFDYLDEQFVGTEPKEPVRAQAVFREGREACLTLESGDTKVQVYGDVCQRAEKQPASRDGTARQLSKTGGTPFQLEELSVDLEDGLFLPVQSLNRLRREGLNALQEAMTGRWHRETDLAAGSGREDGTGLTSGRNLAGETAVVPEDSPAGETAATPEDSPAEGKAPASQERPAERESFLTVSLEETWQFKPALEAAHIRRMYLDAGGFAPETWERRAEECHEAGKECWLMLPHIFRMQGEEYLEQNRERLFAAGFDGILARNPEEIVWLRERGNALPTGLDACVYAWNSAAVAALRETDARFFTLPLELTRREMEPVVRAGRKLGFPAELVVYGYYPMMVTAQCPSGTAGGCSHTSRITKLRDRTGAFLPVKNRCVFCYNTIFNSLPLSLAGCGDEVERLGAESLRLSFTVESREETERILRAAGSSFHSARGDSIQEFTRGHFRRKVE